MPGQQDIAAEPAAVPPAIGEPAAAALPAENTAAGLPAEPAAVPQPAAEPAAGGRCLRRRLAVFRAIAPDASEAQEAPPAAAPLLSPLPAAPRPQDPLLRALAADVAAATPSSTTGAGGQPPAAMTAEQAVHLVQVSVGWYWLKLCSREGHFMHLSLCLTVPHSTLHNKACDGRLRTLNYAGRLI